MDSEYKIKLHHRLSSFEKNHKQWEWSDLIKWLSSLKLICDKFNSKISEDLLLLTSKRLSQCLNPSLPQGIHLETLKIYSVILKKSEPKDILLLSPGLFQHFQYCSTENRSQFLSIIEENFLNNPKLSLLTTGLVACLLSGAGDKQETLAKVMDLLDSIQNKSELHYAVWKFILKSNEFRNIGLMYMQKRTCREYCEDLIISTLLVSVDDPKVINKRLALDIIKTYFPIVSDDKTTVILMHGVFRLYRGKDYSVIRRLWEWAYPGEFSKKQESLIRKIAKNALVLILEESQKFSLMQNELGKDCLKIVEEVCESEEIGDGFFADICLELLKFFVNEKIYEKDFERASRLIVKNTEVVWAELAKYLNENLLNDEDFSLGLLGFVNLFLDLNNEGCSEIVKIVALKLHKVKKFSGFLKFLKNFIENSKNGSSISIKLKNSRKKMSKLLNSQQEEDLLTYSFILSKFMKDHSEISAILSYLKVLSSSNLVLTLKTLQLFEEQSLTEEDFQDIWKDLVKGNEELMKILLNLYLQFTDQWTLGLMNLLVAREKEVYIKVFINFCEFTNVANPKLMYKINANDQIAAKMIESLSDENPTVRHAGREWLNLTVKNPQSIFDALLKTILHSSTSRTKDPAGNWTYMKHFDSSQVLHTFEHLNSLLLQSQVLIVHSQNYELSSASKNLASEHNITGLNYYWAFVETCFLYINTDSEFLKIEYFKVQALACEVLRVLVSKLPSFLYEEILDRVGESLIKNLGGHLEFSLIPVVYTLVRLGFGFFHPSKTADAAALGVLGKDITARQHWGKIFCLAFSGIYPSDVKDSHASYLSFLFVGFCDLIREFNDSVITDTLHQLIRISLSSNSHEKLKTMIFSNIERLFSVIIERPKNEEISKIFKEFSSVYTKDIVKSLLNFWKKHYEHPSGPCENIISKLYLTGNDLILNISLLVPNKKTNEIVVGHLMYSCIEKSCNSIKSESIWKSVIRISRVLFDSKWDEAIVWIVKTVHLLLSVTVPTGKQLKSLQTFIKTVIEKCKVSILKWEKMHPSPLTKIQASTILELILNELTFCQSLFKMIWSNKQKSLNRIIHQLAKTLIDNIEKLEKNGEVVSKCLSSLLISFPGIIENIKNFLTDFVKDSLFKFISKFPKSIEYWFDIISCFPKSTILKTLNTYDKLFLKSAELKKKILKRLCASFALS